MKKILLFALLIFFIVAVLFRVLIENKPANVDTIPQNTYTQNQEPIENIDQSDDSNQSTEENVKKAYRNQVVAPIPRTLGNTYVISEYAIQDWTDGYSGGEILFKQSSDTKDWVRIGADSVWSVEYLIKAGVPDDVANKLFQAKSAQ